MESLTKDELLNFLRSTIKPESPHDYEIFLKNLKDYELDNYTLKNIELYYNFLILEYEKLKYGRLTNEDYDPAFLRQYDSILYFFESQDDSFYPLKKKTHIASFDYLPEIRKAIFELNYDKEYATFDKIVKPQNPVTAAFVLDNFKDGHEIGFLQLMEILDGRISLQNIERFYVEDGPMLDDLNCAEPVRAWENNKTVIITIKFGELSIEKATEIVNQKWQDIIQRCAGKAEPNGLYFFMLTEKLKGAHPDYMINFSDSKKYPDPLNSYIKKLSESPWSLAYFWLPDQFTDEHLDKWLNDRINRSKIAQKFGLPTLEYFARAKGKPKDVVYLFCKYMSEQTNQEVFNYVNLIENNFNYWKSHGR